VAYWLVTGEVVFKRDTSLATVLAHVRDTPDAPSTHTELPIPDSLDQLVLECLAKDPAARPQTTGELSSRLDAINVPPWTADDARKWWALHGPLGTVSSATADDRTPAAVLHAKR
jgi:serine/threonine-protein kinase